MVAPIDDPSSTFRIQPDPPVAGQPAEVQYTGSQKQVDIYIDGRGWKSVYPDKNGKFVIDPMPAGREITLWDGTGYPGVLTKEIQHLGGFEP